MQIHLSYISPTGSLRLSVDPYSNHKSTRLFFRSDYFLHVHTIGHPQPGVLKEKAISAAMKLAKLDSSFILPGEFQVADPVGKVFERKPNSETPSSRVQMKIVLDLN